ncbi:MAG: sugar ABC transporter permease [Chloroflexi bacterium]|nr:MAG: sugar ABC transporter permease [Chloroflexota bacterium]
MSAVHSETLAITEQVNIKRKRTLNKYVVIFLFTAPGMLVFLLFLLLPVLQSSYYSLYKWNGFGALTSENFVGLANYQRLFNDKIFINAIGHSVTIMLLSLGIQLPLAMGLALLVGRGNLPGRRLYRMALFIPFVFSEIITAIIWLYVLHPQQGLANLVLGSLIPNFQNIEWLGDREIVLFSIFAVLTWKYFGSHMILYMAALQGVPKDLEDAGRIDGASEVQVLRHITLPMMGPTIRLTIFLSVLGAFQQFVIIWVMTEGGPVFSSEVMATYLYKFGIQRYALGYGSAVAVVLFLFTFIFSIGYQRTIMRQDYSDETLG